MTPGIYFGDAMDLIPSVGSGVATVCITDPPYGIDYQSSRRTDKTKRHEKIIGDDTPFTAWIKPIYNILPEGGRLVCFYRWDVQEAFLQEIILAGFTPISQIVWDKVTHGMGDLKAAFAPCHELAIYATKGRYEFKSNRPKSIYRCPRVPATSLIHPNEKPINLMAAIIRDITTKNDLIIDPFGGSFSTYKAAEKEGRPCITFELHDGYYENSLRVASHGSQKLLFC